MSVAPHPSSRALGMIGPGAAPGITPVRVALVAAMCAVCAMAGLLMGVAVSGGHVTELFRVVTRATPPRTVSRVTVRTAPGRVTTRVVPTTQVVTAPARTEVTTVHAVSTVTVTTPPPTSNSPSSGTTSP